jgi:hypothetical protein
MKAFWFVLACLGFGVLMSFSSEVPRGPWKYAVAGIASAWLSGCMILAIRKGSSPEA